MSTFLSVPQALFTLCQLVLLVVMLRRQTWRELPTFAVYVLVSFLISLLPRHTQELGWWRSWWIAQQAILLVGLVAVIAEFISWVQPGLMRSEYRRLRIGISGLFLILLPVCVFLRGWGWFEYFVAGRQYAQILLLSILVSLCTYLWAAEVRTLRVLSCHGAILTWFVLGQTAPRVLHTTTGLVPVGVEWQPLISSLAYWNAAFCALLWALVFTRVPWTLASRCGGRSVRFALPDDGDEL